MKTIGEKLDDLLDRQTNEYLNNAVEPEKCKYLNECLEGEVMACYTSPERCDIFKRRQSLAVKEEDGKHKN